MFREINNIKKKIKIFEIIQTIVIKTIISK